ncbi:hypothetical protein GCM10018793_27530 [Streptomyces sulfonofaciens]|uniref:DUF5667 domain-containing protein n=1 Tax=Streptomyces sulfonofaciens TaxID=68272 RepID=A0A919G575_9ACTN|nr:DUF5667 domain-containing protein [Streptomyces sulfonofaciens]GHH78081.1 hypothetical protein GCM10018793_27530 [Streptomyces sulfonofaciens]
MIANVSAHRRANAFAQALEERSARGTAAERPEEPGERTEQSCMLALAGSLADLPRPELERDVKAVQRARLVAAMEALEHGGTAPGEATDPAVPEQRSAGRKSHRARPLRGLRPRTRLTKGLAAGGLTVGVAAGAFGGVAAASTDALPGDSLYGLKRGMEDVRLGLADSDSTRGEIYLGQASTRLNEARRLMERGRSGPLDTESVSEVRHALSGMRHDASEGHRLLFAAYRRDGSLAPIQALSSFSQSHRDSWTALRDKLPVQLGDVRDQVTSVFDAIDQEVDPLRPLLPRTPTQGPGSRRPSGGQGSGGPSGSGNPEPSTPGGSRSGDRDRTSGPEPSTSGSGTGGGILGSSPGGILTPPTGDIDPPSPSAKGGRSTTPEPDITLPPLLPGVLGLGIDGQGGQEK